MKSKVKSKVSAVISLVVIAVAGIQIWRFARDNGQVNAQLHRAVGERLAAETIRVTSGRGRIVVAKLDHGQSPVIDCQFATFRKALRASSQFEIIDIDTPDPEKKSKYGPGTGMSARRFARLVEKHANADLIVSFIGAPDPKELKLSAGKSPRLVAVCRSPKELKALFERQILVVALVPRFHFPAPGPEKPRTSDEWFDRQFEVVTPDMVVATGAKGRE